MSVVVDASLIVALVIADPRQAAARSGELAHHRWTLDGPLARSAAAAGLPVELVR